MDEPRHDSEYDAPTHAFKTIHPSLLIVQQEGKWGVYRVSQAFSFPVPVVYDLVEETKLQNLWRIKRNDKWGIYDAARRIEKIEIEYDKIELTDDPHVFNATKNGVERILAL